MLTILSATWIMGLHFFSLLPLNSMFHFWWNISKYLRGRDEPRWGFVFNMRGRWVQSPQLESEQRCGKTTERKGFILSFFLSSHTFSTCIQLQLLVLVPDAATSVTLINSERHFFLLELQLFIRVHSSELTFSLFTYWVCMCSEAASAAKAGKHELFRQRDDNGYSCDHPHYCYDHDTAQLWIYSVLVIWNVKKKVLFCSKTFKCCC